MSYSQQDIYRSPTMSDCGAQFSNCHTCLDDALQNLYSTTHYCSDPRCKKIPRCCEEEVDTLGSPVGLVCSNATLDGSSLQISEATSRNFATYLKAFALIYVLPEVHWTAEKIDMLLSEGMELFHSSSEMNQPVNKQRGDNDIVQPEIYTDEEKRIKRNFTLEGHTFTLALEPRYLGLKQRPTHTIKNLRCILQAFFKSSRYCLLLTRVGHLLIWRHRKAFFVLDVKGRRRDDLQCDQDNGVAMLVCLKTLENVVHLASTLSGITPRDVFTIRELVMMRLETPDGRIYLRDSSYRNIEFKVVNRSYAYLKATLHLSMRHNGTPKSCSSLMVAVASILASKIDHPANWDTNMLNRLICYGVDLCNSCWCDCLRDRLPIDLDTFPTQLRLGQFVVRLRLIPNVRSGHWKCGFAIIGTDFETDVREAFERYGNVVFQINNQMYAMWAKNDFYYLLDPYRHTIVGTHVAEDQSECAKWATLRMFRDQLTMLNVFHQLLKESNGPSPYFLHAVRIRYLAECPEGYMLSPMPEDVDSFDVESVNEHILFSEDLGACIQNHNLTEISDCEDEDEENLQYEVNNLGAGEGLTAEAAEEEMCEEETEAMAQCTCCDCSLSQIDIRPTIVVCEAEARGLERPTNSSRKSTTEDQNPGKKEKGSIKYPTSIKKAQAAFQQSANNPRQSSPRLRNRKSGDSTRKPPKENASELSRQTGGATSNAVSGSGRIPNKSVTESIIITLGPKVATTNLITPKVPKIKASNVRILSSGGHSTPKHDYMSESETMSQQTATPAMPKQSVEKSKDLGVAPVDTTSFFTPVSSGLSHQAGAAPFQKPNDLHKEKLLGAGLHQAKRNKSSQPRFPGFKREPQLLAVAGSESGTVESLTRLLVSAFKVSNRVLTMTPWGNYVVFRHRPDSGSAATWFYLFKGCTCDVDRFRHMDLSTGTAGLVAFRKLSEAVCHMIDSREGRALKMLQYRAKKKDS